jgi:hypothetical protein
VLSFARGLRTWRVRFDIDEGLKRIFTNAVEKGVKIGAVAGVID